MADRQNDAIVALNKRNQEFWRAQDALLRSRLANKALAATAMATLTSEADRRVLVYSRLTLEKALATAEETRQRFLSEQGRSGGRAKRSDPLQAIIEGIVRARPELTCAELLAELENRSRIPPLQEICEGTIAFENRDGRSAEAPISGLKDRLSRAKKKIRANR